MPTTNSDTSAPDTAADVKPALNTDALRDALHESAHPADGASEEDVAKAESNLHAEIDNLAETFDGVVADLKDNQDKLLSHARELESTISDRTAELAHEKDNIEVNVAERTTDLNAANDELRNQAAELSRRNHEITLLGSMNDLLQTCTTEAEAYSIIAETAAKLFPEDSGAVFVLSPKSILGVVAGSRGVRIRGLWFHDAMCLPAPEPARHPRGRCAVGACWAFAHRTGCRPPIKSILPPGAGAG